MYKIVDMTTEQMRPNVQYMKVSGENCIIEVEFNGTNYNFFCNNTFIGTIDEHEIPKYTNGFVLEHVTGWGL